MTAPTARGWLDPPSPDAHVHDVPPITLADVGRRWGCVCGQVFVVVAGPRDTVTWEPWKPKQTPPARPERD